VVEQLVFDEPQDLRRLLTTQQTWVDPRLAALYQVAAPDLEGFGPVTLPAEGGRRGLLGQASFLLLASHPTRSSATLRGAFVRKTLLCQEIPPPPANVDTSIPEADAESPTLRERIQSHLEEPSCASCHSLLDPIGLGLENFDGIARWRDTENDALIDASGDLDGVAFANAWELGGAVAEHPDLGPCLTQHVYHYAVGHEQSPEEEELVDWLYASFAAGDHQLESLMMAMVASEGFGRVGGLE
jgi:Protein of unknown function (DUF1588)/Protein of unknown function (DUF1585)